MKHQKKYLDEILELYEDFHITLVPLQGEEQRGVKTLSTFCQLYLEARETPLGE